MDVHAHYTPARYAEIMLRIDGSSRPAVWSKLPHTDGAADVDARLQAMDDAGVAMPALLGIAGD